VVGVLEVGYCVRPTPVLFALLALICFGGALLFPEWQALVVALGVVFIVIAVYAWMIL
jgi:ABC-type transport system involved in multi-copper enzyme maturation permease subunit